jgi:hypothetical protein
MKKAKKLARPTYYGHTGAFGFEITYTEEDEICDINSILESRKDPEKGLEGALRKLFWLNQVTDLEQISFSLKEALYLEARYRLHKIETYETLNPVHINSTLLESFGVTYKFGKICISNHTIRNWYGNHYDESIPQKPTLEQLSESGVHERDIRDVFFVKIDSVLTQIIKELLEGEQNHETYFRWIEVCLETFPELKNKHKIQRVKLMERVSQGRMTEAKMHARKFMLREEGCYESLIAALKFKMRLGLTFQDLELTENDIIKFLGEKSLEKIIQNLLK